MTITRTTVAAVLASAAVAGVGGGIALHRTVDAPTAAASSHGPATSATTPATPPATPPATTVGTTPATTPATSRAPRPATPATTTPRATTATAPAPSTPAASPLGEADLLVAGDYLDAGWSPVRITTAAEGAGQATISVCQDQSPEQEEGIRAVFSGVAQRDRGGANQYVKQFRSTTDARRSFDAVDEWRTACPQNEVAAQPVAWSAGPVHQVRLEGEGEGQWWVLRIVDQGRTSYELVANVRLGSRTSVVDAYYDGTDTPPDGAALVRHSAARLG
ncbi:hypothetical protein [Intrasporangium flavum]|uniref:hypothetical protein n=1 Tax=Intrasporangium flavum TaxID=1428657 RepID=UPI00096F3D57|nr:hypothetical protein [Intrasporangium flavum]